MVEELSEFQITSQTRAILKGLKIGRKVVEMLTVAWILAFDKRVIDGWLVNKSRSYHMSDFPHSSVDKESACNAVDLGSIPGLARSPEEGNGNPLQYSCLGTSMDRRAWRATVHETVKNQTQLSN